MPIFKRRPVIAIKDNVVSKKNDVQTKIQTIQKIEAKKPRSTRNSKGLRSARQSTRISNAVDPRYLQKVRKLKATKKRHTKILMGAAESLEESRKSEIIREKTNTVEPVSIASAAGIGTPEGRENRADKAPAQPLKIFTPEEISAISDEIYGQLHGITSPIEGILVVNKMICKYLQHDNEMLKLLKRFSKALEQVK